MKREFSYSVITLQDIDNIKHLIFVCDGDSKTVKIEKESD